MSIAESTHESQAPREADANGLPIDRIGAPLVVCQLDGTVLDATPDARAVAAMLGIPIHDSHAQVPPSLWNTAMATERGEAFEWQLGADGPTLSCTAYDLGGSHIMLLFRTPSDIRAQLERRLHRQRLEIAGRLVGSVAHDLRTAVASIIYNADLLTNEAPPASEAQAEPLAEIGSACRRLQSSVDGLLEFARLGPAPKGDVAVAAVFQRATSMLRTMLRDAGHQLESYVASDATTVRANPVVLEQILVSLLLNAAEAAAHPLHLQLNSQALPPAFGSEGRVEIRVQDDGPGVAPGLREAIFRPFFSTKPNGSGLGLPSAREAAESMQGTLWLEPTPVGACFMLRLPKGRTSRG